MTEYTGRDPKTGKFTTGNTWSRKGFQGLCDKYFDGNRDEAKQFVADRSRHIYFETYGRVKPEDRPRLPNPA